MAAAKSSSASNKTACEQLVEANGEVISGFVITITGRENAQLALQACNGPVQALLFLDRVGGGNKTQIATTEIKGPRQVISLQALANLSPGSSHVLTWVIDGPADDWQLVSEVLLDGTVHYRHLKRNRPGVMNAEMLIVKVRP